MLVVVVEPMETLQLASGKTENKKSKIIYNNVSQRAIT